MAKTFKRIKKLTGNIHKNSKGFTIIECLIASAIMGVMILASLTLLLAAKMHNEMEMERNRAHQIITQALELEKYKLFTWTESDSEQTIWDNGTPDNTDDDTVGTLEVIVKDPKTGEVLTEAPDPATLVEIEATLTWNFRGGSMSRRVLRESVMTYKAP